MAKTQEELMQLKTEFETLHNILKELSDDELAEVTGGSFEDLWKKIQELGEKANKDVADIPTNPIKPIS